MSKPRTLFEKVWDEHVICVPSDQPPLIYIDLHLVHEVTSPQAFDGLRAAGRKVRRPERTIATVDHNNPTTPLALTILEPISEKQMETLRKNCREFSIQLFDMGSEDRGIVHVIGPELGFTQPGLTIVCGDSHTSTHGAFGALAFGIGTSEVEHVLATQCLPQQKPRTMQIDVRGQLPAGVSAKDLALGIIGKIGTDGGTGHVLEFTGEAIRALSMEGRMTLCNMSIEAGARAGMIAPDETTFAYLKGRRHAPQGAAWDKALAHWKTLHTDPGAHYDRIVEIDASSFAPYVTWGTNPGMVVPVTGEVPDPTFASTDADRRAAERALEYMALSPTYADSGHQGRSRFYRIVHQLAHRRSARRRESNQGLSRGFARTSHGGSRLAEDKSRGRERRTARDLHHRRFRVARVRMLDVPGDESRRAATGRALRLHQQPQF